ncbi:MAG: glycosyltransferase family 2 protein [Nitrospirota bacterium]|mgnify:CR=1 FL=1
MRSHTQPLVTVLTPVYNGEKYLTECIESVLAQTYANWEYYILNNRSTDRTLKIAESYAAKDARVRVVTTERFLPIMENHNTAFRLMSKDSKYCKMVHAPDWLFPECVEKMVDLAEAHPSVGIVGAYSLKDHTVICNGLPYPSPVTNGKELGRKTFLGGPSVFGTPTTVLFAADVVRSRPQFYNEASFHADSEACFDVLRDRDFGFVHQVLTYSRVFPENASRFDEVCLLFPEIETLFKYGRDYLSPEEFSRETGRLWDRYYTSLGSRVFRNRAKGFWQYHRTNLKRIGHSLRVERIAKAVIVKCFDIALNPLNTSLRITRKLVSF